MCHHKMCYCVAPRPESLEPLQHSTTSVQVHFSTGDFYFYTSAAASHGIKSFAGENFGDDIAFAFAPQGEDPTLPDMLPIY